MRVTVWGEGFWDQKSDLGDRAVPLYYETYAEAARELYPREIHVAIATSLSQRLGTAATVQAVSLDDRDHGLGQDLIDGTDVLVWWGHVKDLLVPDEAIDRVALRVEDGMGLVVLHASSASKLFRRLMGTSCAFADWRQAGDWEKVWAVNPGHPIAAGVPPMWELATEEMYSEPWDIPEPDALVFISSFRGGEVFRSGCCFHHGNGRIFYFRPGHESNPTYHNPLVQRVLANAVRWAAESEP